MGKFSQSMLLWYRYQFRHQYRHFCFFKKPFKKLLSFSLYHAFNMRVHFPPWLRQQLASTRNSFLNKVIILFLYLTWLCCVNTYTNCRDSWIELLQKIVAILVRFIFFHKVLVLITTLSFIPLYLVIKVMISSQAILPLQTFSCSIFTFLRCSFR